MIKISHYFNNLLLNGWEKSLSDANYIYKDIGNFSVVIEEYKGNFYIGLYKKSNLELVQHKIQIYNHSDVESIMDNWEEFYGKR